MTRLVISFISIIFYFQLSYAEQIKVFEFTEKEFSELKVRKVRGADSKTVYTLGSNKNGNFLKAIADNAASGLGKEIKINLDKTPFLNITWKIEQDLAGIKVKSKKPLDGGVQHTQDYTQVMKDILNEVNVILLNEPAEILPAFKDAYSKDGSSLIIEWGDYYSDK